MQAGCVSSRIPSHHHKQHHHSYRHQHAVPQVRSPASRPSAVMQASEGTAVLEPALALPTKKESLLQALLERAEAEAQRRSSGADAVPAGTSQLDQVLNQIPGKDELTSAMAGLMNGSEAAANSRQSFLQGGSGGLPSGINFQSLLDSISDLLSGDKLEQLAAGGLESLQGAASAPGEVLPSNQAASQAVRAQLDEAIQAVGAAIQLPGVSDSSSAAALLDSRRAAGHLLDLTPVYKAWATLLQPLEIFGDRWLLNILFLSVFALLGFTLLAKAPRD